MSQGRHFVIGGVGFLGSHIVQALKERDEGALVAALDIVEPSSAERVDNVAYFQGDITKEDDLEKAFLEFRPTVVYHTASPIHGLPPAIYTAVNVTGTRCVISACETAGISNLIYTSSTGVVWTGAPFDGVKEEDVPVPKKGYDAYHHTKAIGERLILDSNSVNGIRTVALRLCGMFGERDKQLTPKLAKIIADGQQHVQIGDNTNLIDYMYVGNAAHAHILAADAMLSSPLHLPPLAGETFFITNDSPMPIWNFHRLLWNELSNDEGKHTVVLPRRFAMIMAFVSELWARLSGTPTDFNIFAVRFLTGVQWYDITKAKLLLQYEPKYDLEEGVKRTAEWWKQTHPASGQTKNKTT